jgi:hypothetical protein
MHDGKIIFKIMLPALFSLFSRTKIQVFFKPAACPGSTGSRAIADLARQLIRIARLVTNRSCPEAYVFDIVLFFSQTQE